MPPIMTKTCSNPALVKSLAADAERVPFWQAIRTGFFLCVSSFDK